MSLRDDIVDAMARTLFVLDWAERQEERGRTYPGENLMEIAPPTPRVAYRAAEKLAGRIEEKNKLSLDAIYVAAANAPGRHLREPTPEDFGYAITMQSLGHGVSWADDHPDVDIKLPRVEYHRGSLS
jgi:hypothetical protein